MNQRLSCSINHWLKDEKLKYSASAHKEAPAINVASRVNLKGKILVSMGRARVESRKLTTIQAS